MWGIALAKASLFVFFPTCLMNVVEHDFAHNSLFLFVSDLLEDGMRFVALGRASLFVFVPTCLMNLIEYELSYNP